MGKYEKEARQHEKKIRHYYDHAGEAGYAQAEYHYGKLSDLIGRAARSKNDKGDVIIIQLVIESATPLMDEMKARTKP
jgi:hypothetical protein